MTDPATERGLTALRYVLDYWERVPTALERLDQIEDVARTGPYRAWLYDEVNAAADGDLQRLLPEGPAGMAWIFVVGWAASEATRAGL